MLGLLLLHALVAFNKGNVPQKAITDEADAAAPAQLRSGDAAASVANIGATPRILHLVFTSDVNPKEHANRIRAHRKTWAKSVQVSRSGDCTASW